MEKPSVNALNMNRVGIAGKKAECQQDGNTIGRRCQRNKLGGKGWERIYKNFTRIYYPYDQR
jgi:hypothetical protein